MSDIATRAMNLLGRLENLIAITYMANLETKMFSFTQRASTPYPTGEWYFKIGWCIKDEVVDTQELECSILVKEAGSYKLRFYFAEINGDAPATFAGHLSAMSLKTDAMMAAKTGLSNIEWDLVTTDAYHVETKDSAAFDCVESEIISIYYTRDVESVTGILCILGIELVKQS